MTLALIVLLVTATPATAPAGKAAPGAVAKAPPNIGAKPATKIVAPAPVHEDPIRAEFDAALAPGLGDSTAAQLGRFLEAHPRHPLAPHAQFELGTLAYARGEYGEAREHFRRARSAELADEARYWEGLSAFALGRPRDAREAVLPAAHSKREVPRRWDSAYLVALSWAQEGRRPEALAAYRALFDLDAGSAQAAALYQAQRLAAELSRADEAAEWGKRLIAAYPNSPEAASFRAESAAPPTPPQAGTKPGGTSPRATPPAGGGR